MDSALVQMEQGVGSSNKAKALKMHSVSSSHPAQQRWGFPVSRFLLGPWEDPSVSACKVSWTGIGICIASERGCFGHIRFDLCCPLSCPHVHQGCVSCGHCWAVPMCSKRGCDRKPQHRAAQVLHHPRPAASHGHALQGPQSPKGPGTQWSSPA